jgi:phosphatidylglycerophosphatase C
VRTVAAFDFDKTVSSRDNVVPFLIAVAGRGAFVAALATAFPDLVRRRRDAVKQHLVRRLLGGRSHDDVQRIADEFAVGVIADHLREDVLARASWHREQGHQRVLVSASFASYLVPVADHLGFDAVLATELEVEDGRCSGRLVGANVRGAEKVRRLDAWLAGTPATLWAYGDSSGDRELLARADHPVRVGRAPLSPDPGELDRP